MLRNKNKKKMIASHIKTFTINSTTLIQLNIDCIHHLVKFINLEDCPALRKIGPLFDEAIKSKYRLHFKKFVLEEGPVNLKKHILPQIEIIFSEIGLYINELAINYYYFDNDIQLQISEIIRDKCCSLQSLKICYSPFHKIHLSIPNLDKVKHLTIIHCSEEELVANYLDKCSALTSLTLEWCFDVTGEC